MRSRVHISITCADSSVERSLRTVLTPDNEGAPRGLSLSMEGKGRTLEFVISSEAVATAVSTSMGVLRDVSLFERVWLLSQS